MKVLRLVLAFACLNVLTPAMAEEDSSTSIEGNAYYEVQQLQNSTRSLYQAVAYQPGNRVTQDAYSLVTLADQIAQQAQYNSQQALYQLSTFDNQLSRVAQAIQYDQTLSRNYQVTSALYSVQSASQSVRYALGSDNYPQPQPWPQPNPNPWPQPQPWPQPNPYPNPNGGYVTCYASSNNGSTYAAFGRNYQEAYQAVLAQCANNRDRCTVTQCR